MTDFVGAKAALFCGDRVLSILRDDIPGLPWPGMWDLPGGGREGHETGADCVLREIAEELGLTLSPDRLVFGRTLPSMTDPERLSWLFGGWLLSGDLAAIRFGDEGQRWEMRPVNEFLTDPAAIPEMSRRAGLVWQALGGAVP